MHGAQQVVVLTSTAGMTTPRWETAFDSDDATEDDESATSSRRCESGT
jgi:hypothetical protein